MESVNIEKAANGFIVTQGRDDLNRCTLIGSFVACPKHVFETFDALAAWLKKNFESKQE